MKLRTIRKKTSKVFVIMLLICWNALSQNTNLSKASINDARTAYRNYKPILAEQILNAIWQDLEAPITDRVSAGKYLAQIYAQFLNDPNRAKEILDEAIKLDPQNSSMYLQYSQLASTFHLHELALKNGLSAIKLASSKKMKVEAYGSYGKIVLSMIIKQIDEGPLVNNLDDYNLDKKHIVNTIKQLDRVMQEDPNQLELLKTKFALEVLSGDGTKAINTWKRYFNYNEDDNVLLANTYVELKKNLKHLSDKNLSVTNRINIAKAFANSRNYDLSMVYIKTIPKNQIAADNRLTEIINYSKFLKKIETLTNEYYRETAQQKSDPNKYRNQMISYAKKLWDTFIWTDTPKEFSLDNVEHEIDKRFGAALRIGNSTGWFSITWGHKVIEYKALAEQYGFKATLNFRSLDYMMSNGFVGWYFNNLGTIGGWQNGDLIYQVRPKYLTDPTIAWNNVSNSKAMLEQEEKIKKELKKDALLSDENKIVIFPGMLKQITFMSQRDLFMEIKEAGYSGDELQQKFMSAYKKLTFDNEILFHEGRHMIDRIVEKKKGVDYKKEELEYRAKLSEIAFAKYPFMSLSSILKIGIDNSPHGRANERLVKELYDWMDKNWREVEGIDPNLPKRIQLYKLKDEQLVSIIHLLDPLNS